MAFFQYLKDTRAEMNHVAWPTRTQTVVFTVLVILVSLFTALYLGFFDYILTQGLGKVVERFPGSQQPAPFEMTPEITTEPVGSTTGELDIESVLPSAE